MQKSFIERVFPNPKNSLLPQYDTSTTYHDDPRPTRETNFTRSTSNTSDSRSSVRSRDAGLGLPSSPPASASIIHHKDPFIAVDRAAQNLQKTIQSFLDFQNESLSGRHQEESENLSQRGLTPAQSVTTASIRTDTSLGAVPIRQPARKKTTLRGARRGIGKAMREFAALKEEELRITQDERTHRKTALEKVTYFEAKRESVQLEITNLQTRASGDESNVLREEAREVQKEIHELEGRLMELKAKNRHLSSRAEQIENSAASDLSSYQGALALVDREVRSFLRYPSVKQGLGPRNHQQGQDMYSLRPERRSLGLAKEQWTTELETLEQHEVDTRHEKDALVEGAKIWQETVQKVDQFEENIRARMKITNAPVQSASTSDLVSSLNDAIQFLEERLSRAELNDWKLLICAIGAELESFRQARVLLAPDDPISTKSHVHDSANGNGNGGSYNRNVEEEDADVPHADLLGEDNFPQPDHDNQTTSDDTHVPPVNTSSSSTSNESLKATLKNVPQESIGQQASFTLSSTSTGKLPERRGETRYSESEEDDDPGPEFLLSR